MNVEIKKKDLLEKEIIITLSNEEIENEKNKKISELLKSITIKGFRKGHITQDVLINKFGEKITNDSLKELINKIFIELINKNNFKIINLPIFQISKINENTKVVINFEILPEIKLNIDNIKIIEYISEIKDEEIADEIEKLKIINGKWEETNLPINFGDLITLDIFSLENEQETPLLINNDVFLHEEFVFFDGFINIIKNYSTGMDISINIKDIKIFDKIFYNKNLIKIYIKKIMRSKKIETEIELKEKLYIKEDIIEKIKDKLEKISKNVTKKLLKVSIINKLLENNTFEIPKYLMTESLNDYEKKEMKVDKIEIEKNIKLELLLNEIKIKFNINVLHDEIQKVLDTFYKNVKNNKDDLYKKIENNLLEEKIFNLILNKANKMTKKITYKDLKKLEIENVHKY
ncbi:trigger factor [Candidatus Azoamicus ciliaticola]|uniref:Trigger factor n=1 Tax=Candidatus Azoamicus ciliaticola TaxID=2652803 RepID=A0A6J5JZ62_9GAMM|nr:trigger factor [Candidatus Azoamicus ciliaticola]CAB3976389.1 Trigger factor [Candidatus Azoamicus ciliaticola]